MKKKRLLLLPTVWFAFLLINQQVQAEQDFQVSHPDTEINTVFYEKEANSTSLKTEEAESTQTAETLASSKNTVEISEELTQSEHHEQVQNSAKDEAVVQTHSSIEGAAIDLLKKAAVNPEQIGSTDAERIEFAKSLGMIPEDPNKEQTLQNLEQMQAISKKLAAAYRSDKQEPLILNGRTQPIFPFSPGDLESGYSNDTSDIVRFVVYVETDLDTDGDGKRDLVKTFVQLPKAAAKGDYKAATIYEASPYVAGTTNKEILSDLGLQEGGQFDMKQLYRYVEPRIKNGEVSTLQHAKKANSKDWYYQNPNESNENFTQYDYENLNWYNYFLVRGYAVVTSSGLGSYQSEGINTTGSDLEVAGYKSIIEWLTGKRVAYTDKSSNIAIKADWSNGNVGMLGLSWAGTTTFGVASTGVEGLKTIVPGAGIASWYDHYNSQGTTFNVGSAKDLSWLSIYVSNRILNPVDWEHIKDHYARYITQLNQDQHQHGFNYSEVWEKRDYTRNPSKFSTSTLIVHGLNDDNVKPKQFDLMFQTLKKAGQTVKLFLHQGDHVFPFNSRFAIKYGGQAFSELLNLWFSHYLYNVNNGIENLSEVTVSSNYNPNKWETYDSWKSKNTLTLKTLSRREEELIDSDYIGAGMDWTDRDQHTSQQSSTVNALFTSEISKDITIKGVIPVHFSAALAKRPHNDSKDYQINVQLVDLSDDEFNVAMTKISFDEAGYKYQEMPLETLSENGYWLGSNLKNMTEKQFTTLKTRYKVISSGWINLANPASDYDSHTSRKSIEPKIGEFHNYTVYLQPNLYTVQKGHKLGLIFTTFDSNYVWSDDTYSYLLKTRSIQADLPIVQESQTLFAWYQENREDKDYQLLPLINEPLTSYPLTQPETVLTSENQANQKFILKEELSSLESYSEHFQSKNSIQKQIQDKVTHRQKLGEENLKFVNKSNYLPETGSKSSNDTTIILMGILLLFSYQGSRLSLRRNRS